MSNINANQKHLVIIFSEIVLAVVIIFTLFFKATGQPPAVSSQNAAAAGDPMADHHRPQPADSAIFDSLVNQPAPDFTLTSYEGRQISLKDYRGKNVILFFNEGLMCYPSCWNQITAFGLDPNLKASGAVVLNITVDSKSEWQEAVSKMPDLAKSVVLLDPDRTVSGMYGVLSLNSSMHRGQFPGHTYVLLDKAGVVRFTRDDPQMAVRNKELLAEIAKLK